MLIIVFVTVIKNYTIYHFILIMSVLLTAKARLFRTRTLSEASLIMSMHQNIGNKRLYDYVP